MSSVASDGMVARPGESVDEERDELALAGRLAHAQIQGVFSGALDSEVPIPRATKTMRGTPCPPSGTAVGRADFFNFSGGLDDAQVGEIKSVNGARFAGGRDLAVGFAIEAHGGEGRVARYRGSLTTRRQSFAWCEREYRNTERVGYDFPTTGEIEESVRQHGYRA